MNPSGNKTNKALIKVILTVLIITVIFSLFSSLMPTGFVGIKKEFRYSDSIGLAFNKNQTYTWTMGNYGKLSSVRLDGSVTKRGSAKVYLKYQNNSYLVFDSSRLDHSGLLSITGMALSNTTNQSFQDKNKNETDPAATKRIELYIQGGGSKAEDEVFELKTASSFSWDVDYDKLCTRWSLTSSNSLILPTSAELNEVSHPDAENGSAELINDISSVSLCRGSEECCSFLNMESSGGWDSAMHISYGRYGSGKNNTVSAQVIYYDVDLSVPYSEIVYSSVSSVRADFYEPRTEFRDICLGTCLLPEFNEREYEIILVIENATLNIDKIKYSVRQEVNVSENAPELINRFENVTVYKNDILILNLSKYFKDEDNSWLDYSAYQEDNITISINNPIAAIMPHANFTGKRYMFFNAYDENYNISSNIFAIRVIEKPVKPEKANISEKLIKPRIVINRPVRWVKKVNISDNVINLSVNISSHALNVTVRDVREKRMISQKKVKVNDKGIIKNSTVYTAEKRIEQIEKIENKLLQEKEEAISERPDDIREISQINERLIGLENERNKLTGYAATARKKKGILTRLWEKLFGIEIKVTGYASYQEGNKSSNTTSVIIEDIVEEVEIEYYTEAPTSEEENISNGKRIVISSDVHYEDILAYTYLDEIPRSSIRLYRIVDNRKELVRNITYYDENNNTLVDMIEWTVPSLSNQTYEVEITILNVQSYPAVGGNWTVMFNTTGTANLTITAVEGTTYSEVYDDNSSTEDDLVVLELRCGNITMLNKEGLVISNSTRFILENGTRIKLNESMNKSLRSNSIFVNNYSCYETGYYTVKVLTPGKHSQLFEFGEQNATANNLASVNASNTNLTIWDSSDTQTVYANYTMIYANYTNITSNASINGSGVWCEFRHNKTGRWSSAVNMSFNPNTLLYEMIADGKYTDNHTTNMPVGTYFLNISCFDKSRGYANLSAVDVITISNYSTSLSIENETGKVINEQVYFYANYTKTGGYGIPGLTGEIGQVVWNSSDMDVNDLTYSIAFADLDNDGSKDEVVLGEYRDLRAFYSNGTLIGNYWPGDEVDFIIYEIEVGDLDNDGYYNDMVIVESGDYIRVFNETGEEVWNSGDLGIAVISVVIGDLDNDGLKDDFAAGAAINTSLSKVMAYNTSDGKIWQNFWNGSEDLGDYGYEMVAGDFDRDGKDDVATVISGTQSIKVFAGNNGSLIFKAVLDNTASSLMSADLDHDGYEDEIVGGAYGAIYAYVWNGTYGVEYQDSPDDYLWKSSVPEASLFEIVVLDLDGDGYEDDLVVGDEGTSNHGIIWGFDNNSNQLWNYTLPTNSGNDKIYSISIGDVNSDGLKEIVIGSEEFDRIYVLNKSGSLLWEYTIGMGDIGSGYGSSPATDISDINNDGIMDIAVASEGAYAHVLNDMPDCIIFFNDSTQFNMTWDNSIRKWSYNRTFSSVEDYAWNVTCTKNGYEEQTSVSTTTIATDTENPEVSLVAPDNGSIDTDGNVTFVYNATDNAGISNCSIYTNISGNWQLNRTSSSIAAGNNTFNISDIQTGSYVWNVLCYDVNGMSNWSFVNWTLNVTITGAPDSTAPAYSGIIRNDSAIYQYEKVRFNATWQDEVALNYSIFSTNVSGSWKNSTPIAFDAGNISTNVSLINATPGKIVGWMFYANDSSGNINKTQVQEFTVGGVIWNQTILQLGNAEQNDNALSSGALLYAYLNNSNVNVSCYSGNCSVITANFTQSGMNDTNREVLFNCSTDALGNFNASFSVNSTEDRFNHNITVNCSIRAPVEEPPTVTLNAPLNNANLSSINISFNFTAVDSSGLKNATLFANFSGTWKENETNKTSITSGNYALINVSDVPEGSFIWNVYVCDDAATPNCSSSTANYTLTVDRTAPSVKLESPSNNTRETESNAITFRYNVSDGNPIRNCSLVINRKINRTNTTVARDVSQNFTLALANGNYNWSVNCSDAAENVDASDTYNLSVSVAVADNAPNVSLVSPSDASTDSDGNITFTCNVTDDQGLVNVSLYQNISGAWQLNQTANISGTINSSSWNITDVQDGTYVWNCLACDNGSNCAWSTNNYTFTVNVNQSILITSTNVGVIGHGDSLVISGINFGSKSTAAPVLWDDGTQWNNVSDVYTGPDDRVRAPNMAQNSSYNIQYRNVSFRNVNGPHNYTTKFIAGGHHPYYYSGGPGGHLYSGGPNVHVAKTGLGCPTDIYASWYIRQDPLWPEEVPCPDGCYETYNMKTFTIDSGNFPFSPEDFYLGYRPNEWMDPGPCLTKVHGNCTGYWPCDLDPDNAVSNPIEGWVKSEVVVKNQEGDGWLEAYQDNELGYVRTGCYPSDACANTIGIGSYWRNGGEIGDLNAWRYFVDIYLDTTFSRVILANNQSYGDATIIEPQIPSAWSNSEITVTTNLGRLSDLDTVYLFVFDANNNRTEIGYAVTLEGGVFPAVTLNQPVNNHAASNRTTLFNCSATDNLNIANITLYGNWSGTWHANETVNLTGTSNSTTFTKNLTDGTYIWNCLAYDNESNTDWGDTNYTLTVDTTYPTITLAAGTEANNTYFNRDWIYVNITADDANEANITFMLVNSTGVVNTTTLGKGNRNINFTSLNSNGEYWYNATIEDDANNRNSTVTRKIILDSTYPAVSLDEPLDDSWDNDGYVSLKYTVTENNTDTCSLYHNASGAFQENKTNSSIISGVQDTKNLNFSDGRYIWNVWCNDSAGNYAFNLTNYTINVDTTYPTIGFAEGTKANNTYFSRDWIYVNITANEANEANITFYLINSSFNDVNTTTLAAGARSINFTGLDDGLYYYNVTIEDRAGNKNSTETRVITLDTTGPIISFAGGTAINNSYFNRDWIYINISITEINFSNVTFYLYNSTHKINTTTLNDSTRSINFTNLNLNKRYYYNATVVDKSENDASTETRRLTLDSLNPNSTITYPANNTNKTDPTPLIRFNLSDNLAEIINYTVFVNDSYNGQYGNAYNDILSNFTLSPLSLGDYYITLLAKDQAGNEKNSTNLFISVLPPAVYLSSPIDNLYTNAVNINFTFNVSDPDSETLNCSLYINGALQQSNATTKNYTPTTFIVTGLSEANNQEWMVKCINPTNNTGNNTKAFNIDLTNPSIDYANGTEGNNTYFNRDWIYVSLTVNETNIKNITLYLYNMTALVNKTIYTTAIYSINFTSLPRTTYLYNATIYDKASNYNWTSIRTITLVQDATPPNINLRSPADGASWTTSSTVTFTYNVSDDNPIRNCSLIINGVIDQTDVTITRNISQTFTKSLANADHNWSVTCYDNLENQGNSSVYNLTVNYVSSSTPGSTGGGGGGSGSGGGGSVPALADNIKTKTWYEVYKGKEIEWEIGDFTVTSLKADIERDSSEAKITVTLLEEKPENISAVDNPYHYFEITTQNMNVKKADIQFRVDRSWAAGKEIILSRYNRGWADIPTRYTRRDLTYNYYNAETKGFSYFAIRGESIEKEEDLTVKEDIIQNETQEEIEKPIRLGQKKNTARNIVIFAIEMIIIISLARVIMVYKKKRARIRRIRK